MPHRQLIGTTCCVVLSVHHVSDERFGSSIIFLSTIHYANDATERIKLKLLYAHIYSKKFVICHISFCAMPILQ